MQDSLTLSLREFIGYLIATFLGSTTLATIVGWLLTRQRQRAETVEIHARTVKVEAEARQVSTHTIIEAQQRIVAQGEMIGKLQDLLIEANRERDNFEYELGQERHERLQLETRHKLAVTQIDKMHLTLKAHGLNYDDTKGKQ